MVLKVVSSLLVRESEFRQFRDTIRPFFREDKDMGLLHADLLLFVYLIGYANADCIGCDAPGHYCCYGGPCCFSVFLLWWFWVIVGVMIFMTVAVLIWYLLRQNRQNSAFPMMQPMPTPTKSRPLAMNQPPTYSTMTDVTVGGAKPGQTQVPPPYPGEQPIPAVSSPELSHHVVRDVESNVNKDTEMLVS